MNRIHRTVFNRAKGLWQVAAEIGSARGKGAGRTRRRATGHTA
ncbi:MAG: ESPR domain-containing protein, partial [Halorhodospira sp.]